ncbi:hypothetical protein K9M48_02390 [Candidatus Gracilibacteria bacterium]|nr:hypothetical protein [Candidatus Gracilibacteria bacterium]
MNKFEQFQTLKEAQTFFDKLSVESRQNLMTVLKEEEKRKKEMEEKVKRDNWLCM